MSASAVALQRVAAQQDGCAQSFDLQAESLEQGFEEPAVVLAQPRLCVLWKPAGWAIRAAYDDEDGAQVGAWTAPKGGRELQAWLASRLGGLCPIARDAAVAHGLVHRLDKDTSGALIWASSYGGHYAARLQLTAGRVRKDYLCLCRGPFGAAPQLLEDPLQTLAAPHGGVQSIVTVGGKRARTEVYSSVHAACPDGSLVSLSGIHLYTGRTHQIRAHLGHQGHPLLGDLLYGGGVAPKWCPRIPLHASELGIDIGDGALGFAPPAPKDLHGAFAAVVAADARSRGLLRQRLPR
mmetsp:Transcript_23381/g.47340  ORF Transcript_23381/g.47340 Transcript_23381/m.47340 type:complete len:294 (-) Transcript_23381:12-893(-)